MKKTYVVIIIILSFFTNTISAFASVTAKEAVVMDIDSGRVLYEKDKNSPQLIASITKIMTAVIAIENGNLDKVITVGDEVLEMYGSNIYIEVGEEITIRDLLYGLLMRSGNDAAVVIAKNVGGTIDNFVDMMNKKAKEIGMKNTIYKNPHGLDEDTQNYSTAYDMALLSSYAYKLDEFREISKTKKYQTKTNNKSYIWYNRNKLLTLYKYATGGKTGYTPKAGKTLVTTASKDDLNLTIVTLKDGNQYDTHEYLYDYYFNLYDNYLLIDKDNFDIDDNFYKDDVYVRESFTYPLTKKEKEKTKVVIDIYKQDNYEDNGVVGVVKVLIDTDEIYKENIYVKKSNKDNKSLFRSIVDFFKSLLPF